MQSVPNIKIASRSISISVEIHAEVKMRRLRSILMIVWFGVVVLVALVAVASRWRPLTEDHEDDEDSKAINFKAPAGTMPTSRQVTIDGLSGAVLPNGRFITPAGAEISVRAPKPYGMALSTDGNILATVNSGVGPFSITLFKNIWSASPQVTVIPVSSTFMGIVFSPDSSRFYAGGGENGIVWVGSVPDARIIGSVNLNGAAHPISAPWTVTANPGGRFKGAFPGNLAISGDGRLLYAVDQAGFHLHVIDTTRISTGLNSSNQIIEPNNFQSVVGNVSTGRYPYGVTLSPDGKLFVTNVGLFQYTHLQPPNPTGDANVDYPLGYPGAGYPDETEKSRTIKIKKVDPRNLPPTLRDPEGIRVGYIDHDQLFTVPGLGSPNVPESSSVYIYSPAAPPSLPAVQHVVKTGLKVGDVERGLASYPFCQARMHDSKAYNPSRSRSVRTLTSCTLQKRASMLSV